MNYRQWDPVQFSLDEPTPRLLDADALEMETGLCLERSDFYIERDAS
jgi:hypothetical protein